MNQTDESVVTAKELLLLLDQWPGLSNSYACFTHDLIVQLRRELLDLNLRAVHKVE